MKNISKILLAFVLGILISFTINVAAETILNSEAVSYFNSNTNETTVNGALNELFSALEISKQIGDITKIANIGDGTITGAISTLNSNLETKSNNLIVASVVIDNISVASTDYYVAGSKSIAKDGYKPIGVVGYHIEPASDNGNGFSYAILNRCIIYSSSNLIGYTIANSQYNNIDLKVKLTAYVLYVAI